MATGKGNSSNSPSTGRREKFVGFGFAGFEPESRIFGFEVWKSLSDASARLGSRRAARVRAKASRPWKHKIWNLQGAEFMHWWQSEGRDSLPYGPRMPVSTEQILHPDRYAKGDAPVALAFPPDSNVTYEDVLGENEIRVIFAMLAGSKDVQTVVPIGWGGDRFRLYRTPDGPALVWYVVWDDGRSGERFLRSAAGLRRTPRPGYVATLDSVRVGDRPATRYVLAPRTWDRWETLPSVVLRDATAP
jgi:hypothetical protein